MVNKWRFKIELKNETVFSEIEKSMSRAFPSEIKEFIRDYNAASPDLNRVLINGSERILDAILSFNKDETEAVMFKSAFKAVGNKNLVPFATDPFGNYFCISLDKSKVVYYTHEEQKCEATEYSLKDFIDKLY